MFDTITYGGVKFIRHTETYEIRKNQTGKIQYYTKIDTGESGISVQGLANACGVARPSLIELLKTFIFEGVGKNAKNASNNLDCKENEGVGSLNNSKDIEEGSTSKPSDLYLIETKDVHVMRDIYCERVIYYYAFESYYKKTKARELYQSLAQHGLRLFIQSKTGYQAEQATQHDDSLALSIDEQLKKEVAELKLQLVEQQTTIKQLSRKVEDLEYVPHLEKTYQAHLHGMIGGTRELHVSGPYPGRVDIATDQMIVEVKKAEEFEKAFGQLLRYRVQLQSTEHANKTYSIFLFGNVTQPERDVLEAMASMTNFQLIIHKDIKDFVDEDELSIREKIRIVS